MNASKERRILAELASATQECKHCRRKVVVSTAGRISHVWNGSRSCRIGRDDVAEVES